jgi:SPP1 family phage portal protein
MRFADLFRMPNIPMARSDRRQNRYLAHQDRLRNYERYLRSYQGYSVRGPLLSRVPSEDKRIKFNYSQPVVNLSSGWMCSQPVDWEVDGDPDATKEAYRIWDRSGSDRALLDASLCGSIYGDMVAIATQDDKGKPRIEFVDPSICYPTFDGSDYSILTTLDIAWQVTQEEGMEQPVTHREFYTQDSLTVYENDVEVERRTYDAIPAVWIRNASIKGQPFGLSDLQNIVDLVEEYDHIASKQTRIIDYYASPALVFHGVQQKSDIQKDMKTAFFMSEDGKVEYLEWKGNTPDIETNLTRIRNAIAEISQVPAVAFGQSDSGLTSISGVALQILYGPLINKTRRKRSSWGPGLEYLMQQALLASGYAVDVESVNIIWPESMPVDGQGKIAEETAKVAANLSSRRTAMNNLGVEDPNKEFKRIVVEEMLLGLTAPQPDIVETARAASKGNPVGLGRQAGVIDVTAKGSTGKQSVGVTTSAKPSAPGAAAGVMAPPPPPTPQDQGQEMADLLAAFDLMIQAEETSIDDEEPIPPK